MNWITCSLGARKALRHYLYKEGIDFKEDKGFITSTFYFKGLTQKQEKELAEWVKFNNRDR